MADDGIIAVACADAGFQDFAVGDRADGGAFWRGDIQAVVEIAYAVQGIVASAESRDGRRS